MTQDLRLDDRRIDTLINSNLTENKLNELRPEERLTVCIEKIKNGRNSESQRWDCLIIISELYVKLTKRNSKELHPEKTKEMLSKIESTLKWMIYNEKNCVVHHEVAYQVAARNMTNLIPDMVYAALNSQSIVSRHEFLECLGVMKAFEALQKVIPYALKDNHPDVQQTATFAEDRMKRYKNEKDWSALEIV
ncbi:MAG: HEAT repeat domain-containing protein [Nitrosopumilus sp.]|nr:HEAT repeat domain-containing protein [Nitrosopumilus sp.]MDH3385936.1 HEAT repeat domain-containing protein [Nitrosopumilus sp.]